MHPASDRVVTCQHCGQAYGARAPRCPHCGHQPADLQGIGASMAAEVHIRFGPLRRMLEQLATVAWESVGAPQQRAFCLDAGQLLDVHAEPDLERVLEALLNHARRVAPGFSVPYYVPRVQIVSLTAAGGQFREEPDGWVTITVADQFLTNPPAVRSASRAAKNSAMVICKHSWIIIDSASPRSRVLAPSLAYRRPQTSAGGNGQPDLWAGVVAWSRVNRTSFMP
jgi:hypothetical protein